MSLREWMQKNQVFDKDLLRLWPQYGVNNPDIDLRTLSAEKWAECKTTLMSEKRAELKDSAARQRFEKKLTKITKLWKASKKQIDTSAAKRKSLSKKRSSAKRNSKLKSSAGPSPYSPYKAGKNEEHLKVLMENRKLRRELSSKNSDYNRLEQEFHSYVLQKEKEIKTLTNKLNAKNEEYDKLLRNYKQINQRINSKYHDNSAKDKEIDSLKEDKSTLLNDINQVMTEEHTKYEELLERYNKLQEINNINEKYKSRYKRDKKRQKKGGSFTQGLRDSDDTNSDEAEDQINDISQKQADYYRSKKYKPSKEKRKKARQRSEILSMRRKEEDV